MYDGPERRNSIQLTAEQLEQVAELAAEKAIERVYTEIGKNVVHKALWVLGAGALALFAWLKGAGKL